MLSYLKVYSCIDASADLHVDILRFMRKMYDGFAALPAAAFHGELGKKMQVTKESLQKVENGMTRKLCRIRGGNEW